MTTLTRDEVIVPRAIEREWRKAIREGMKFLDNYYDRKDWVNDIDLNTLDLNDGTLCVAGQLFETEHQANQNGHQNGYEWVLKYVVEHEPWAEGLDEHQMAKKLGFYVPTDETDDDDPGYDDPIEKRIAKRNGVTVGDLWHIQASHWELFTREWEHAIIKRREELA